jgi:hypothetical protein
MAAEEGHDMTLRNIRHSSAIANIAIVAGSSGAIVFLLITVLFALPSNAASFSGHHQAVATQPSGNDWVGETVSAGAALAGAMIGGFAVWFAAQKAERQREKFEQLTTEQQQILQIEDEIFKFGDAVVVEIDAVTDAQRINAEVQTNALGARVVALSRNTNPQIRGAVKRLVEIPNEWRELQSNRARTAILTGLYKETLTEVFGRIDAIYNEAADARASIQGRVRDEYSNTVDRERL